MLFYLLNHSSRFRIKKIEQLTISLFRATTAALALENANLTCSNFNFFNPDFLSAIQSAQDAALLKATNADFTLETTLDNQHGVEVQCGTESVSGNVIKYIDIVVMITNEVDTSFTQILSSGPFQNTIEAVSRVQPRSPLAFGNMIVALDENCTNNVGIKSSGNGDVEAEGGGIFSNSCMKANGNGEIDVDDGPVNYVTTLSITGNADIIPDPVQVSSPISVTGLPALDCSSLPNQGSFHGSGTIQPGCHSQISASANYDLELEPGLYCLTGNFSASGNSTVSLDSSAAPNEGVTFYMQNGRFSTTGNNAMNLQAPLLPSSPAF